MPKMAFTPVAPTTAAIAPKAPTGASHMIMMRMRKTSACPCWMALSTGWPCEPMRCSAKPTRMATRSVGSTGMSPGMMPSRKSAVLFVEAFAFGSYGISFRPSPGWMMLPTTKPMASANVDITRK